MRTDILIAIMIGADIGMVLCIIIGVIWLIVSRYER